MKLGIVSSNEMAAHWAKIARQAGANEVTAVRPEKIDSASSFEALWIADGRSTMPAPVQVPVLYPAIAQPPAAANAFPSFPLRQRVEIRHLKEVIEAGKMGQVGTVRISLCRGTEPGSLCYSELAADSDAFEYLAPHGVDAIRWCFGEIDRLTVMQSSTPGTADSSYSVAAARLTSGAIAHLECSLAEPAGGDYLTYEIAGSNGILEYDSRKEPTLLIQNKSDGAEQSSSPIELVAELKAFLNGSYASLATAADANAANQVVSSAIAKAA